MHACMYMYVCLYVCMYVCVYHVCVCMYVCIMYVCMCIYVRVGMSLYLQNYNTTSTNSLEGVASKWLFLLVCRSLTCSGRYLTYLHVHIDRMMRYN